MIFGGNPDFLTLFDPIMRNPTKVFFRLLSLSSHYCCLYNETHPSPSRFLIWLLAFLTEFVDLALCYIRDPPKSNDPLLSFLVFFVLFWSHPRATTALGSHVPSSMFSLPVPILVWQDSMIALVHPNQSSTRLYPVPSFFLSIS